MIRKRHAQRNNPPLGNFYTEQALSSIVDCDANNLYALPMSQFLPMSYFCWVGEEWNGINWQGMRDRRMWGYIIECLL